MDTISAENSNGNAICLIGRIGHGLIAVDADAVLELHPARAITPVPSSPDHIVGILARGREVIPVVDLALQRPPGYTFRRPMAAVVAIHTGGRDMGIYLDSAEALKKGTKVHLSWSDRFYLKRLVWNEGSFTKRLKEEIDGVVVPIIDTTTLKDAIKKFDSQANKLGG